MLAATTWAASFGDHLGVTEFGGDAGGAVQQVALTMIALPTPVPTKTVKVSSRPRAAPASRSPQAAAERSFTSLTGRPTACARAVPKSTSRQPRLGALTTTEPRRGLDDTLTVFVGTGVGSAIVGEPARRPACRREFGHAKVVAEGWCVRSSGGLDHGELRRAQQSRARGEVGVRHGFGLLTWPSRTGYDVEPPVGGGVLMHTPDSFSACPLDSRRSRASQKDSGKNSAASATTAVALLAEGARR